jgi:mannosyltransferase
MIVPANPQTHRSFLNINFSLLGIAIGGLLLRLWHLTDISLWHDEAFSALLIKYSWSEMMTRIGLDVHPPMYYIFLRLWSYVFGHSLFSLRGMSVMFGVATIMVSYYLVRYIFNSERAAKLTALLIAVNPFQVQYVTEARMYTMGAFFAVAGAFALVAALRTQSSYYVNRNNIVLQAKLKKFFLLYYGLFALCSAILIYTHYYLLFMVAALGLYAILYCAINFKTEFKKYTWVALSGILIGISFLPWLKVFLFQFKQVGGGYWIPPMDRWSVPSTLWELLLRLPVDYGEMIWKFTQAQWAWILISVITLIIIIRFLWKYIETEKWLILGAFLAPFGGAILFLILAKLQGNDSSVYLVRYFIFCSSFYLMIVALFLSKLRVKQIGYALAVILAGLSLYSIWNYWDLLQVQTKPGMAAVGKFLDANAEPTHKIYVGSSFQFFNYKYYNHTSVKPLLFTDGHYTHDLPHYAGTAILTDDDLVLNFSDSTRPGDTIWLIWTNGFGGTKPATPEKWEQVAENVYPEIRPYVGTNIYVTQYKVN